MSEGVVLQVGPDTQSVRPNTLIIRPMEYNQFGVKIMFSGVFGTSADSKENSDVWCATFYDRDEAEMFVMASKSFGKPVIGVRLPTKAAEPKAADVKPQEGSDDAVRIPTDRETPNKLN